MDALFASVARIGRPARTRYAEFSFAARVVVAIPIFLISFLFGSCSKSEDLNRLFDLEARSSVGAPPQSIEELKAGISKYAAEADRKVAADEKVGLYYKLLATRYLENKMFVEAYDAVLKGLEYYPTSVGLFYSAGYSAAYIAKSKAVLGTAGEAEQAKWLGIAEASYLRAIDGDPSFVKAMYGLAVLYEFELERPFDAEPLLRRVLAIETKNLDAIFLLARVLYRLNRLEESADLYGTAAALAPSLKRMSSESTDQKKLAEENRNRILREIDARSGK